MDSNFCIIKSVYQKLTNLPDGTEGNVFAIHNRNCVTVIAFSCEAKSNSDICLPGGVNKYGTFLCSLNGGAVSAGDSLSLAVDITSKDISAFFKNQTISLKQIEKSNPFSEFLLLRINYVTKAFPFVKNEDSVKRNFEFMRNMVEVDGLCLKLEQTGIIFPNDNRTVKDILKNGEVVEDFKEIKTIKADLLLGLSKKPPVPLKLILDQDQKTVVEMSLLLDTLTLISVNSSLMELFKNIHVSLLRSLKQQENILSKQTLSLPETFHFRPLDFPCFLTVCYLKDVRDENLVEYRKELHKSFGLPEDRPFLRRPNAFSFESKESGLKFEGLLNPHEGLKESGVAGGDPALVKGNYCYYHYLQQGMQDSGWGCAYRSLQTICSWFRLQGYTNRTEPTHREIQKCLVDIKDKPSSFIGSSQWIGSTEVGFVLDTLYSIESRYISVSSGEELSMKGGELSHHFRNQGTPVMIGGGQLAHTILGVDYNRKTGDIKFLILDPHYTGQDNLETILAKGWCGWKGPNFWKKSCFYNMCLPQRPNCL